MKTVPLGSFTPAEIAEEQLLNQLLSKFAISSTGLLRVVSHRLLDDQRATAADLWKFLSLRGETKAAKMASRLGDVVSAEGIAKLLDYSKSGVHKAKTENRLLAFRLPTDNSDLFPVFQVEKGEVRTFIPQLLALIGNGLPAAHFLTARRHSLNGESYVDRLQKADDPKLIAAMLRQAGDIGRESAEVQYQKEAAKAPALETA